MAATFELIAEIREDKGRGASRRLRRNADKFPGIIYGGEQEPQMIEIEHRHIVKALENEAFYSHIITLQHTQERSGYCSIIGPILVSYSGHHFRY